MNLPSVVPVMLLQQCNVFPLGMLPLYIFEPRYREMLKHALQTDRMICIGNLTPSDGEETVESDDRINDFSTLSVIRACVGNDDGTSHLVLQGVHRIKFESWEQYEPFRIARVSLVDSTCRNAAAASSKSAILLSRILGMISPDTENGRQLTRQLTELDDPGRLADFVAGNLIRDAAARQPLLGMADVEDRIDFLLDLIPVHRQNPANS